MTVCEIVNYGCPCNGLSGLAPSGSKVFDVWMSILPFSKTLDLKYGFLIIEAKTENVEEHPNCSISVLGANLATYK